MKCFECDETTEIKKYKVYLYEGISLNDVHLFNVEVVRCSSCGAESPLIPQVLKIHAAIGLAVVRQPARLNGNDIRFLRKNAGFSLKDWANRIGIAEATYSKRENSHHGVSVQLDRLIRTNYLNAMKQKYSENFELAKHLETALSVNIDKEKDFAIVVNAENPEKPAEYLSFNSPRLKEPKTSYVEAGTMRFEPLSIAKLIVARPEKTRTSSKENGEILNASYQFAATA
jgi:transcriptional regulator with XRE-family HTH domain